MRFLYTLLSACLISLFANHTPVLAYDIIISNGTIYDGSGSPPFVGTIAINADTIAAMGNLGDARGKMEIDANGLAVAPGFINMMSWAPVTLIEDGHSQSGIRQGVTLEVMGEGASMGPVSENLRPLLPMIGGNIKFDIEWTTLGEYLQYLEDRGVATNVASFVGATTIRINVLGMENRAPTPDELDQMTDQVHQAMREGALGLSTALIYAPAFYADTSELIALAKAAGEYGGIYTSHLRSEGNGFLEAVDEFLVIAREADVAAEIFHLKAAGKANWHKLDEVIEKIEQAREEGLQITTDMYPYTAAATGLSASMPPWAQEGGLQAWIERMKDPDTRKRVLREISTPSDDWENFYLMSGSPDNVLFIGFKNKNLQALTGKTLAEVAAMRGTSPEETMMDLVIEDESRVDAVYFVMSEDNIKKKVALPWMSFCSDAPSMAPEGVFLKSSMHPRAYGAFARVLGKYVREEKIITLEEAIRKLTSLPATNLKIDRRGSLKTGNFADVVVFDPKTVQDHATFETPHQYSTGMIHVFVNGTQVLEDGEHTGAKPGRAVRGPGWKKL